MLLRYSSAMYFDSFGLREAPFAAAPDTRFAYLPAATQTSLDRLQQEVMAGSGGILLLTGEYGSGKTLLSQLLLQRLEERSVRVARVLNPGLSAVELVQTVCDALRVPVEPEQRDSGKSLVDALSAFLMDIYAQGQRVLLVVDEAQNLSDEALEQLRLLTNLETPAHKLIHVLLLAGPTFEARLQGSALQPLAQRVAVHERLEPLSAADADAYVRHRLEIAGGTQSPFSRLALRVLYRYSRGQPRLINRMADRALHRAAAAGESVVGERLMQQVARECLQGRMRYTLQRYRWWASALLGMLVVVLVVVLWPRPAPPPVKPVVDPDLAVTQASQALAKSLPPAPTAKLLAWSELLARWQVGSEDVSVSAAARCTAQIFPGFDCVGGTGSLDQLKRFDRPLILELDVADGTRDVLLLGVGRHNVRLDIGPRDVTVSRKALKLLWHGRFYAPCRLPTWMPPSVKRGDAGKAVAWVSERLERLDSNTDSAYRPALFDAQMEARVRKVQQAFGIPADGIVGPETLFALSSLSPDGPHLARNVD
ncbi:ExeA family protein [Oleiagrimonas sp. C23AA]|uniref:ExeA family protein n=1 Tax=Oleiagrimonas sp. C23AA TaxID=2719047 RepID=UPI00198156C1|nr:ExeA family protein [Oleiagrimonas sp. C23AA]NII12212.1 AAA family ATPase [Oleiagrimonas sp. C23AA]